MSRFFPRLMSLSAITLLSPVLFAGAFMASATEAQAATKLCGLLTTSGSIAAGDRVVTGVVRKYNDAVVIPPFSCASMRDTLNAKGVTGDGILNGANPPQAHRVYMLQNNNASSSCEPDKLNMEQDKNYNVSWDQKRDGTASTSCWTIAKVAGQ